MNKYWSLIVLSSITLWFSDCVVIDNQYPNIPPGIWRGALKIEKELVDYSKKPKKKGGFSERLAEAMKEQQKIQAQKQAGKNRKKK